MTNGILEQVSKPIYGTMKLGRKITDYADDVKVARGAMETGVWFHTSQEYGKGGGTFAVLRKAYDEARSQVPPAVYKIRCDSADFIRFDVEDAMRRLGVERVDVAQLCRDTHDHRRIVDDFLAQGPMWQTCNALKEEGKVGEFVLEIFEGFSDDARKAIDNDLFAGYILYFNTVERQASNACWDALIQSGKPILSLRTMGGGFATPEEYQQRAKNRPDHPNLDHRGQIEPIYEKSSSEDWLSFNVGYIFSVPSVIASITGSTNMDHIKQFIEKCKTAPPLFPELAEEIQGIQRSWHGE